MTAAAIADVLRSLAMLRQSEGQTFRAECIKATATQLRELTPAELARVGLQSASEVSA